MQLETTVCLYIARWSTTCRYQYVLLCTDTHRLGLVMTLIFVMIK